MNKAHSYPYLLPSAGTIQVQEWRLVDGDSVVAFPPALSGWDQSRDLTAEVDIRTNTESLIKECGFDRDAEFYLLGGWSSPGTSLRATTQQVPVTCAPSPTHTTLRISAGGDSLAGSVVFRAALVLGGRGAKVDPLAASQPGNLLWSSSQELRLEGLGGRFPAEWIDFSHGGPWDPNSAWALEWDPADIEAPALAGMRLYLNSSHPTIRAALDSGALPEVRSRVVELIRFDMARQMILGMLTSSAYPCPDAPIGSIGQHCTALFESLFPGESTASVAERSKTIPSQFETELQGKLHLLQRGHWT